MRKAEVGVLGASSMVGHYALSLLVNSGCSVVAFSRTLHNNRTDSQGVKWRVLRTNSSIEEDSLNIEDWLCFCPITVLANYYEMFERAGARRVIALSSTSRFTKTAGAAGLNAAEVELAKQLERAENHFEAWATSRGIEWAVLRPTLIYDLVRDKNLRHISDFISKVGFFPLLGNAKGLRQPVYAGDIAEASIAVLYTPSARNTDYNLSGGEAMAYREMVMRIFSWIGLEPKFYKVPMSVFRLALFFAKLAPRYKHLSITMVERMEFDMVFEHQKASNAFGYSPRKFLQNMR